MNEAMQQLLIEAETHDGFPAVSDQAQRAARAGERKLITVGGDPLVALGIVGQGELDLVVRPDARNRGIGGTLFDELLEQNDDDALRVWVHGDNPAAEKLVRARDFTPVRTLLRLGLAGSALTDVAAQPLPEGLTLTTYDSGNDEQAAALIGVNARAFASHPEQGQLTLDELRDTMRESWFDAADLLLAYEGDELLAFSWIKTTSPEPGTTETELYVIGVDPAAAGRGLGTSLLSHTLVRMAEHAPARVTLFVEGTNEPALALYRRAGFETVQTSRQWLRGIAT